MISIDVIDQGPGVGSDCPLPFDTHGLGLNISKRIAAKLDGEITYERRKNTFTVFTFKFKAKVTEVSTDESSGVNESGNLVDNLSFRSS